MPELNLNTNQAVSSTQAALQKKPPSRWKRTTAAGLLSFLIPGMGQLYNRQPRKALWMALTFPVLAILAVQSRLLFSFLSMVAFFAALIVWRLFIAAEATYSAWAAKKPEATPPLPRLTYPVAAVVLVLAALYPSPDQFKRWTSFGAFKVPSASMCPTICLGERFVADMGAYKSGPPQRGDLILLKHKSSEGLFIKRVIGIPGDVVAPGANGSILINGKPLTSPEVCGISPIQEEGPSADYPMFKSIKVPEGTFFVVGDNLGSSFDSRIPEFGAVVLDDIRGRPLFLYWSPSRSRIGCRTR